MDVQFAEQRRLRRLVVHFASPARVLVPESEVNSAKRRKSRGVAQRWDGNLGEMVDAITTVQSASVATL
jgi:hypothetical protein